MKHYYFGSFRGIKKLLAQNFLTGIFVLVPLFVVAWLLSKVFKTIWSFNQLLPTEWQPIHYFDPVVAQLLNFCITIGITVVFATLVSLLGWGSKQYLGAQALKWLSKLIQRIPVIRAVYSSLNQLLNTLATGDKKQFSRVVYIQYPRAGSWALAFVTSPASDFDKSGGPYLNVYVPTTPNPTSGFHLIVAEKDVRDSGLSVEEAFKTILSLGIASSHS